MPTRVGVGIPGLGDLGKARGPPQVEVEPEDREGDKPHPTAHRHLDYRDERRAWAYARITSGRSGTRNRP